MSGRARSRTRRLLADDLRGGLDAARSYEVGLRPPAVWTEGAVVFLAARHPERTGAADPWRTLARTNLDPEATRRPLRFGAAIVAGAALRRTLRPGVCRRSAGPGMEGRALIDPGHPRCLGGGGASGLEVEVVERELDGRVGHGEGVYEGSCEVDEVEGVVGQEQQSNPEQRAGQVWRARRRAR